MFKVEMRDNCKVCGGELPNARFRTYCSAECRNKRNNKRQVETGYALKWQKEKRDKVASVESSDKVQCLICKKWYKNVYSHISQTHKMSKEDYDKMSEEMSK